MAKEKKEKKKKEKSNKPRRRGGRMMIFMLIVGSLAMIITLQMTYVMFVVGMMPSFVAYYIDRTPSHTLFHTVMPCNLSGVLPFLVELVASGNKTSSMQMMLGDLSVVLMMYCSAALGWLLVYGAPLVAGFIINALNDRQISRVKNTQEKLVQEWGPEVTRNEAHL